MKRRLHDDRPARANERDGTPQAFRAAGHIHHHVEAIVWRWSLHCRRRRESEFTSDRELAVVATEHRDVWGGRSQHLRDDEPHPSVADDRDTLASANAHLLEYSAGGRDRFHEHRRFVVNSLRNCVQVFRRQRHELRKRAIAIANPEDVSLQTMFFLISRAPRAGAATDVDLADDTLADPRGVSLRRRLDDADELVTGNAGEPSVALEDLKIRPADAGHPNTNKAFAFKRRHRDVLQVDGSGAADDKGLHVGALSAQLIHLYFLPAMRQDASGWSRLNQTYSPTPHE